MVKKIRSFAEKAAKKRTKDVSYVKYVKSVRSEKTGYWRFNEQMLALRGGESLQAALKRLATQPVSEPVSIPAEAVEEQPTEKVPVEQDPGGIAETDRPPTHQPTDSPPAEKGQVGLEKASATKPEAVPSDETLEGKEAPVALEGSAEDSPAGGQDPREGDAPGETGPAPESLTAEVEPAVEEAPAEAPAAAE